jgi:hypothetical protein
VAADLIQFVDAPISSPTVLLDLNDDAKWGCRSYNMSPPPLRRAATSSLLRDGEYISSSAYGNRVIALDLDMNTTTQDLSATEVQKLARILDAPRSWLKFQPTGATAPVFFRTWRADAQTIEEVVAASAYRKLSISIPAEPAAIGLREDTIAAVTVTHNPAAGTRGMFADTGTIKGDLATPMFLWLGNTVDNTEFMVFATETAPAGGIYYGQGEAGTNFNADTAVSAANDALMSGAGNNYARTTFATTTSFVSRLDIPITPLPPIGEYTVMARIRATATMTVKLQASMKSAGNLGPNASRVNLSDNGEAAPTAPQIVNLGILAHPPLLGTPTYGYATAITPAAASINIKAGRLSGSGNLDYDYVELVPTGSMVAITAGSPTSAAGWVLDGINDDDYHISTTSPFSGSPTLYGKVADTFSNRTGGIPMLVPNAVNRIHAIIGSKATVTDTHTMSVSYWPRYIYLRPAAT